MPATIERRQRKLIRLTGTQEKIGALSPRGFRICYADDGFFASACLRPHYGSWHRPGHRRIATAYLPAVERS